jgi:hypothetical protein
MIRGHVFLYQLIVREHYSAGENAANEQVTVLDAMAGRFIPNGRRETKSGNKASRQ